MRRRPPHLGSLLAIAPLVLYTLIVVATYLNHSAVVWDPPMLLPFINTIVFVVFALVAVVLASLGFMAGGSVVLLLLSGGIFIFGLANLVAPLLNTFVAPNDGVTAHNMLALLSGLLILNSVLGSDDRAVPTGERMRSIGWMLGLSLASTTLISFATVRDLIPPFITDDGAFTPLRMVVLGAAVIAYAVSAALAAFRARSTGAAFLRWYAIGLAFIALGLVAVGMGAVGSEIGWAGRIAQQIGQVYLLMSLRVARREGVRTGSAGAVALADAFQRTQEALNRSRAELSAALDGISDSLIITDDQGSLVAINDAAHVFYRLAPGVDAQAAFVRGEEFFELSLPDGTVLPSGTWPVDRALRGDVAAEQEYVVHRADTGETWVASYSFGPVRDQAGEIIGTVITARDITAEKHRSEDLHEAFATTQLLLSAADAISASIDPNQVIEALIQVLVEATGRHRIVVSVYDADTDTLEGRASTDPNAISSRGSVGLAELPLAVQRSVHERRIMVIDYEDDRVPPLHQRQAAAAGLRLALSVPLVLGDTVVGHIGIDEPGERVEPTPRDLLLVEGIASQAAVAVENSLLFEREQARRRLVEALHGVMEVAVSTLDAREATQKMLEYLVERHEFEFTAAWLAREERLELMGSTNLPDAHKEYARMPLSARYDAVDVFQGSEPIVVSDISDASGSAERSTFAAAGMDIGTYAAVPLRSRGRTIGTLHFGWRTVRRISDVDLALYRSLGRELGVVLENAQLFGFERDIADRLQEALLALPSQVEGVEFAHDYRSAMEAARVGGDFYDVFELGDRHVGVVIGDVAGKGLDAAVLTSLVKNTIRAHASERGKTPAQVLTLTNDVVYRATSSESFVTVFFGIIDRSDGRLVYANAGHTSAGLVRGTEAPVGLRANGPLLGAFGHIDFEQAEAALSFGDLLLLYTDGLTEARRGGEFYGERRVQDLLGAMRGETPAEVVRGVVADALRFSGNALHDDMAILCLRLIEGDGLRPVQEKLRL